VGAEPELAADAKESFDTRTLVEWRGDDNADPLRRPAHTVAGQLNLPTSCASSMDRDGERDEILRAMRAMLAATGMVRSRAAR